MKQIIYGLSAIAAVSCVLGVALPSAAATNTLTSIASVDQWGEHWKCGFQGYVTTTDQDSVVMSVYLEFTVGGQTTMEGGASYLAQEESDPLTWDYNGKSTYYWQTGYHADVWTMAAVRDPNYQVHNVESNHIPWTSGS